MTVPHSTARKARTAPIPVRTSVLATGLAGLLPLAAVLTAPSAHAVEGEGGYSFNSATPIAPGTHRQLLAIGEHLFWRIDLKAGQTLRTEVAIDLPTGYQGGIADQFGEEVYNPTRTLVSCTERTGDGTINSSAHVEEGCDAYNIGSSADYQKNPPGTYYIQVALREGESKDFGKLAPITVTVTVTGSPATDPADAFDFGGSAPGAPPIAAPTPTGAPSSAAAASPTPPADTASDDEDNSASTAAVAVPAAAGTAALLVGFTTAAVIRRRRTPSAGTPSATIPPPPSIPPPPG